MRFFLLYVSLLVGCATPAAHQFEERVLDSLPADAKARSFQFTRDGRMVAYIRSQKDQDTVVVNRIAGKTLSLI